MRVNHSFTLGFQLKQTMQADVQSGKTHYADSAQQRT